MPGDVVGWVSGPTERGTLKLVWSCAITIFACTWTVLHLNLPGREDTSLTVTLRKFKWMFINILFPEFVFSKAVCDLRLALQELRDLDDYLQGDSDTIEWSLLRYGDSRKTHPTWEIAYPDGWCGLLYDLLRLDRPAHLLRQPAENVARKCNPLSRLLRRCIVGSLSVSKHPENAALEMGVRQPMEVLEAEDCGQTIEAERQSDSVHESSSPEGLQQNSSSYHLQDSIGDLRGDDHAPVDGAFLEGDGIEDDGHATNPRYTQFQERDIMSTITQQSKTSTRIIPQQWTVVHSYYAQMGGLVLPGKDHRTGIITASHLTERYGSYKGNSAHPLTNLILGKDDIQDKSKADWLLKSLAVLQITWIIINVIVRHTTGLPISQIEIATMAFAIIAVMIYLANWWKPKDISQPTALQIHGFNIPSLTRRRTLRDKKQSFTQRVLSPIKAIERAERGVPEYIERVANDVLWLEGDIPLLFYLMAGSSFIFGALHCLAWNFEFPTRVELICWRVASLASAVLPVVALAISTILGHLVPSKFPKHRTQPRFWAAYDRSALKGPTSPFLRPHSSDCSDEAPKIFAGRPKQSRNWEKLIADHRKTSPDIFPLTVYELKHSWEENAERARSRKKFLQKPEMLEVWCEYEDIVKRKHPGWIPAAAAGGGAETTCLYQILDVVEKISTKAITSKKRADQVSNLVSITTFILYTAARLIILVLCFTSLRAAPAGLYQDNVWTRFLPRIS